MAVARKHERHVQPLAGSVEFSLLEPVGGRQMFGFGFDKRYRNGLSVDIDFDAQGVIYAALCAFARFPVNDLDSPCCLLAANQIFCPAAGMDSRIDKLRTGICF